MAVDYRKEGKIGYFTLNRPEALNSINLQLAQEFHKAMVEFRDDPEVWVGIVTGSGNRSFCAGADIKDMLPFLQKNADKPWALPAQIWRGLDVWKPLIAAVNGYAFGGGLEIAVSCDIRIASENARFGTPEVGLGLIPGFGGTQRLPRLIPSCKAAELLLTGKPIDAQEAYRIGLVNKVVTFDQLMPTAKEWADNICANGPLAVRAAKEAMLRGSSMSLDEGLRLEMTLEAAVMNSEDFIEGTTAFVEKRKANYEGK